MADSLVWKYVAETDLQTIRANVDSAEDVKEIISDSLIDEEYSPARANILLDLYMDCLRFSFNENLSDAVTSLILGLLRTVHDNSMANHLTMEDSFTLFRDLLLKHAVHRPPFSVAVLTLPEVKTITDWVVQNYFKLYKLYTYAFMTRIEATLHTNPQPIEAPFAIRPLGEARKLDDGEEVKTKEQLQAEEEERLRQEEEAAERQRREEKVEALKKQLETLRTDMMTLTNEHDEKMQERVSAIREAIERGTLLHLGNVQRNGDEADVSAKSGEEKPATPKTGSRKSAKKPKK